jgi:hypothetical protein
MGELKGKQLEPRYIASLCFAQGWKDAEALVTAVAVCLAESQGFDRAFNDNTTGGAVTSRDVGIFQINIPVSQIGTSQEEALYEPVTNVARAWALYTKREFQPWYAYTKNVYLRDTYIKRAARGVGNFLAEKLLERTPTDLLGGEPYEHSITNPVLDYSYRLAGAKHGLDVCIAKARQLKPIGGPAVDAKADEIIKAAAAGLVEAKR